MAMNNMIFNKVEIKKRSTNIILIGIIIQSNNLITYLKVCCMVSKWTT